MEEDQEVGETGQRERPVGRGQHGKSGQGRKDFQNPGEAVPGMQTRPCQDCGIDTEPEEYCGLSRPCDRAVVHRVSSTTRFSIMTAPCRHAASHSSVGDSKT